MHLIDRVRLIEVHEIKQLPSKLDRALGKFVVRTQRIHLVGKIQAEKVSGTSQRMYGSGRVDALGAHSNMPRSHSPAYPRAFAGPTHAGPLTC
jgi:hypothetical protein